MFFGSKSRAEEINVKDLPGLLDSLFDQKLGAFKARTSDLFRELSKSRQQFTDACERFGLLNVEPDTEDLYSANVNFIKNQKGLYARALKRLMVDFTLETGARNAYDKCSLITSKAETLKQEVLKTNATFRQVVQCYPNHLSDFKRAFSSIEKSLGLLKGELERKSQEASEYKAVEERIGMLESYRTGLETLRTNLDSLRNGKTPGQGISTENEQMIKNRLAEKREELQRMQTKLFGARKTIVSLTGPLDRPAKKFDHISARKRPLHLFIEDTINMIRSDSDYKEFLALLHEFNKSLEAGSIEVKNRQEVAEELASLLGSDLYAMLGSLKSLEQQETAINLELRALEKDLAILEDAKNSLARQEEDIKLLEKRIADMEKERTAAKTAVEKLFKDHYGKLISIVL